MDRQSKCLTRIAKREALIAQLEADNLRDRKELTADREACVSLEAAKSAHLAALKSGRLIPVDFRQKQNKPPKKAA